MHSCSVLPPEFWTAGNETESAEERTRKPTEPVSTKTLGMVLQLEVLPGTQTVTDVQIPFTYPPDGPKAPKPTVTSAVLVTGVGVGGGGVGLELLSPFPQLARTIKPGSKA